MEKKKNFNFTWYITAFLLATTLWRHFDSQTNTFKMPWLDYLSLAALVLNVFFIVKEIKEHKDK